MDQGRPNRQKLAAAVDTINRSCNSIEPGTRATTTLTGETIISLAPLLCVEILSHEDRLNEIRQRVADYRSIGAPAAWVVDPWRRVAYEETSEGLREPVDGILRVVDTAIAVSIADLFAQLDEF